MCFEVDENTLIGDILNHDETTAQYFLDMGMHCLGCPSARGESIVEACMVHGGVSSDGLVAKLRDHMAANGK